MLSIAEFLKVGKHLVEVTGHQNWLFLVTVKMFDFNRFYIFRSFKCLNIQ